MKTFEPAYASSTEKNNAARRTLRRLRRMLAVWLLAFVVTLIWFTLRLL